MEVENIRKFLSANYSDERLNALLDHTESGRLGYESCCCFIGIPTAAHALRTSDQYMNGGLYDPHHAIARETLPFAVEAEKEFCLLGETDDERRTNLLPLIYEEMGRRTAERLKTRLVKIDDLLPLILEETELRQNEYVLSFR